jgi:hypothetical protein
VSERERSIRLGVVVEKRASAHPWGQDIWRPLSAGPETAGFEPWTELVRGPGVVRYHAATVTMTLYRKETEAYLHNLQAVEPALYVVLRAADAGPMPVEVYDVTASPYLAQDHLDSDEDIVERVPVPPAVLAMIEDFVATHHVDEPFRKRKRDKLRVEEQKFGKQPIFVVRERPPGGKLDG